MLYIILCFCLLILFYVLFKDAFRNLVRMIYTNTVSFFLYFFVEDLSKQINACAYFQDSVNFSERSEGHLSVV